MFFKTNEPHGLPHHPFKACVAPRPIGWISTVDKMGNDNLAPFSFFNGVAQDPPQVMIAVNGYKPDGSLKDTRENIEETGEFVVNVATWDLKDEMFQSSAPEDKLISEAELSNLEMISSHLVAPKRVKKSPIHMECKLLQMVELLSDNPQAPNCAIFGHVVGIHIADEVLVEGKVDLEKVQPITRLGYKDYARMGEIFQMNAAWRKS